ncbi:hypothetical protein CPB85DRAFT_206203 [Mucidula mucida]|nr:hypothetical protein CPB85DRAFT_206203 [Mucidula mucida]
MGQRHQAFLIAKVVLHGGTKAYYRCIAAWHHQWCYGRLPIDATRRPITLLKQKDNAEIVRDEIVSYKGSMEDLANGQPSPRHHAHTVLSCSHRHGHRPSRSHRAILQRGILFQRSFACRHGQLRRG